MRSRMAGEIGIGTPSDGPTTCEQRGMRTSGAPLTVRRKQSRVKLSQGANGGTGEPLRGTVEESSDNYNMNFVCDIVLVPI